MARYVLIQSRIIAQAQARGEVLDEYASKSGILIHSAAAAISIAEVRTCFECRVEESSAADKIWKHPGKLREASAL